MCTGSDRLNIRTFTQFSPRNTPSHLRKTSFTFAQEVVVQPRTLGTTGRKIEDSDLDVYRRHAYDLITILSRYNLKSLTPNSGRSTTSYTTTQRMELWTELNNLEEADNIQHPIDRGTQILG